MPSYKNAMNCRRCPESNGPEGCPVWIEYTQTNDKGEMRITKECGHQAMPKFMIEVIKAANRPAAAIESTRNDLVKTLVQIAETAVVASAVARSTDRMTPEMIARVAQQAVLAAPDTDE